MDFIGNGGKIRLEVCSMRTITERGERMEIGTEGLNVRLGVDERDARNCRGSSPHEEAAAIVNYVRKTGRGAGAAARRVKNQRTQLYA